MRHSPSDTARRLDALLRDLGPQLRRGGRPTEPLSRFPTGIPDLDRLLEGGFPHGRLSEIAGPLSSGRTSLALCLLARATRAGEMVAVVDAADAFDPASAQAAGAQLDRVLWARAAGWREALRSTERLLEAHGFALVLLDLPPEPSERIASAARPEAAQRGAAERRWAPAEARPEAAQRAEGERRWAPAEARPEAAQRGAAERRWAPAEARPEAAQRAEGERSRAVCSRLVRAAAAAGTALVVLSTRRRMGASAELAVELRATRTYFTGTPALLEGLEIEAALVRHSSAPTPRSARVRLHSTAAA
jgi:hypothetical protein